MNAQSNNDAMPSDELFDEMYEKYGKPLEPEHRGEFLAVSREGKTVIAKTLLEAANAAESEVGQRSFLFKIGEASGCVGNLR